METLLLIFLCLIIIGGAWWMGTEEDKDLNELLNWNSRR